MRDTTVCASGLRSQLGSRRLLTYKGQWYGIHVMAMDRFYPSSKLCSAFGHEHDTLTLTGRRGACPSRGAVLERDLNAACNIEREGLRLLGVAVGPGSRVWEEDDGKRLWTLQKVPQVERSRAKQDCAPL